MSEKRQHHDRRQEPGPLAGVLEALSNNRAQLQHNLEQAARRLSLPPFASASGGLAKALPQAAPAVLAAGAAALGGAAATQPQPQTQQQLEQPGGWKLFGGGSGGRGSAAQQPAARDADVVCIEFTKGKRRVYRRPPGGDKMAGKEPAEEAGPAEAGAAAGQASSSSGSSGFVIADDAVRHRQRLGHLVNEYLLPQGFPDSVAPEYSSYMMWRGIQYFFGGAMSVFTTKSLLASLGVSNRHSGEAAAAINWVVKDGAGRLGRFLFARWGRELDCELKQFRLAGDALMEAGAALELSTVLMPRWFLPLASTANLAKNLAAVAASSTRAPIYRTFARQNNLADVTAKGESVANLADVVGTAFGIALAKANLPVVPTFCALSVGYLVASRREVDSVVLPYLNRARLSYVARAFLSTGNMPAPPEANLREPLMPWSDPHSGRVVLGATVEEACAGPRQLAEALAAFSGRQYALTYRPDTRKCYALLKRDASQQQVVQAAMDAHCLLWLLDQHKAAETAAASKPLLPNSSSSSSSTAEPPGGSRAVAKLHQAASQLGQQGHPGAAAGSSSAVAAAALRFVSESGREVYQQFEKQAAAEGWRLHMTMLNPRETRLVVG